MNSTSKNPRVVFWDDDRADVCFIAIVVELGNDLTLQICFDGLTNLSTLTVEDYESYPNWKRL